MDFTLEIHIIREGIGKIDDLLVACAEAAGRLVDRCVDRCGDALVAGGQARIQGGGFPGAVLVACDQQAAVGFGADRKGCQLVAIEIGFGFEAWPQTAGIEKIARIQRLERAIGVLVRRG